MTGCSIHNEIGSLADLDLAALRSRWRALYSSEAPIRMSREILVQAIAFRLQENAFGGLSPATRVTIAGARAGKKLKRTRIDRSVKAGTRLIREWQGRTVEVIAQEGGGYLYHGRSYRSLSAIARQITGTRWSGPAFFGLNTAGKRDDGAR